MHINRFKSTITLLVATAVLILIYPMPLFAVDPLYNFVEINCTGGVPDVKQPTLTIEPGRSVMFKINPTTCDTVFISGTPPIGNFTLRDTNSSYTITFPTTGEFFYTVTDSVSDSTKTGCSVTVRQQSIPSLSSLGIIILIALIIIAGVYLWLRRKPVSA